MIRRFNEKSIIYIPLLSALGAALGDLGLYIVQLAADILSFALAAVIISIRRDKIKV